MQGKQNVRNDLRNWLGRKMQGMENAKKEMQRMEGLEYSGDGK